LQGFYDFLAILHGVILSEHAIFIGYYTFSGTTNYSSVFSFWDRIAGTFRLRRDGRPVSFGLDEYDGEEWQRITGMLVTPFVSGGRGHEIIAGTAARK